MALNEETAGTNTGIDEAIGRMETLYRTVTGANPPSSEVAYSPIPVEKDPSKYVEQQLDRLLSMLGAAGEERASGPTWTPPVTIWEDEKEFLVAVEIPGVARKDVELTLHDNLITVSGRRPAPALGEHRLRASERPLGPFVRKILLPPVLRHSESGAHVTSQLRDGLLEIRIAKEGTRAEKPKPIPVN